MLDDDEIVALYSKEYFNSDYHCGTMEGSYVSNIELLRKEARPLLSLISKHQRSGDFLEIGCAAGATLKEAQAHGFTTVGVELSREMAEWGTANLGIDIRIGTVEEQKFPSSSFNVVYLGDVIEHLRYPADVLNEIHRILRPDGIAAFSYPMELNHFAPRFRKTFGLKVRIAHQPYHLYCYSMATMERLLTDHGFDIVLSHSGKIVHRNSAVLFFLDVVNAMYTLITGYCGDRGFTMARVRK